MKTTSALLLCLAAAVATPAGSQESGPLTGTLAKIKDSGTVTLGYRQASFPFSYADANANATGRPMGYSIDLCLAVVDEIRTAIDRPGIEVRFVLLRSEERLPAVREGRVDLECGSTTNTHARQKEVAFSPVIFVTGTKLLVRKAGGARSAEQLSGKTIVVSAGTTNEAAIRSLSQKQSLALNVITRPDLSQAFEAFESGQADAFATDEVLLFGFLGHAKAPRSLAVIGDYMSFEPYGLVYRRDDLEFGQVVDRAFRRIAESRELAWTYDKWFMRRLPGGELLGLRINPQLQTIFEALGLPP